VKILVTGADGFVGSRMVPKLVSEGHTVTAAVHPSAPDPAARLGEVAGRVSIVALELPSAASIREALAPGFDAVLHLAALASGSDARKDPAAAWRINAEGTAILAEVLAEKVGLDGAGPRLLVVSTAEVYGAGPGVPRRESDPLIPRSPYAASKAGAEIAALEVHRRTGLAVIVARAFPHTGAGQDERYVVPAIAKRIRVAKKLAAPAVRVGNLDIIRELMHVDDVIEAYSLLLSHGQGGEVYNVASGQALSLEEMFYKLCDLIGYRALPEPHPSLMRVGDIPYLVGDATKLRAKTGWTVHRTLEQTLQEVVDAQAD
jgi:GDP-4-dehydro-6-deoxy-D-mannose reductase